MPEGLIAATANTTLDGYGTTYPWIKLHVGAPGAAGTANPSTETTRKQASWAAAAAGSKATNADLLWPSVAGSEDHSHYSAWTLATGGSCGFTGVITANAVTAGDDFKIASGGLTATFPVAS